LASSYRCLRSRSRQGNAQSISRRRGRGRRRIPLVVGPVKISDAHSLRADLYVVIDTLKEALQDPSYAANAASNAAFLNTEVLLRLKAVQGVRLDPSKLVKMCTAEQRATTLSQAATTRLFSEIFGN
jgi:hypothetical protein